MAPALTRALYTESGKIWGGQGPPGPPASTGPEFRLSSLCRVIKFAEQIFHIYASRGTKIGDTGRMRVLRPLKVLFFNFFKEILKRREEETFISNPEIIFPKKRHLPLESRL